MTVSKQKQAKQDLLRELETLRTQLDDPANAAVDDDEIPLLLDKVEKAASSLGDPLPPEEDLSAKDAEARRSAYDPATEGAEPSPEQKHPAVSADTEVEAAPPVPNAERPRALGENPFLPKHIRERLQERRQALENNIAQAGTFTSTDDQEHPPSAAPLDEAECEALIDEIVAAYLPRLEAELRDRLTSKLRRLRNGTISTEEP